MPPASPETGTARRRVLAPLALALAIAGCTEPGLKQPEPWEPSGSAQLYDQLGYWPQQEPGEDDGLRCVPASLLGQLNEDYGIADSSHVDLWSRVRAGFAFEGDVDERRIDRQMDTYSERQRFFDSMGTQASPYLYYVVGELEERNMPLEIALLPILESGYNPGATSRSQAAGMWQMVPGTARHLGLQQNGWYDGRRDVVASTEAALDYLEELHKRFDGDWYLALAAYNAGEGSVQRAIDHNRRLGKPTDYWSLPLSQQACNYVPRLLALSRVLEDPADHGVALSPIPNAPSVMEVEVNEQVDLRRTANRAGMNSAELLSLNPALKHGATAPNTSTTLLVPAESHDSFVAALAGLPSEAAPHTERYRVRSGDTLRGIARLHQTTPEALRELNGLKSDAIVAGEFLGIPGDAVIPPHQFPTTESVDLKRRGIYVVKAGDSLWRIAARFGMSASGLAALNGIQSGATLQPGQRFQVRAGEAQAVTKPATGDPDARQRIGYTVKSGDSLSVIAGRFKVDVAELMRWNSIDASRPLIRPGQSLVLYVESGKAANGGAI